MLKKASFPTAYSGFHQYCACPSSSTSNSTSPSVLPIPRARPACTTQNKKRKSTSNVKWRSYATVRDPPKGYDFRDNMNWPCCKKKPTTPSPYEIFDLEKGAVYTKHKYYELVKIYHPDRHSHDSSSQLQKNADALPPPERLERYRLVVQAHEILSDPAKRRAYDVYGAGWGQERGTVSRHSRGYYSSADGRTYGFGSEHDSSPFANATWEDWEKWYSSRSSPKQSYAGTYMNPNAFASFVILFAVISGVAQATRAGQTYGSIEEKAAAFTEETSRFLTERAGHYQENKMTSDGRIRHFLEKRDPSRYGLKDEEEETYRRHFGGSHMFSSPGNSVTPGQTVAEVEAQRAKTKVESSPGRAKMKSAGERAENGDLVTLKRFD